MLFTPIVAGVNALLKVGGNGEMTISATAASEIVSPCTVSVALVLVNEPELAVTGTSISTVKVQLASGASEPAVN